MSQRLYLWSLFMNQSVYLPWRCSITYSSIEITMRSGSWWNVGVEIRGKCPHGRTGTVEHTSRRNGEGTEKQGE